MNGLNNLLAFATVTELDEENRRLKVEIDDENQPSGWIPWPDEYGANYTRWRPVRLKSQVVLGSPSGNLAQAVILGFMFSDDIKPGTTDPNIDQVIYDDGTVISYDIATHKLTANVAGDVEITAKGDADITAAKINLNPGGKGVVTGECICPFTGAPHADISAVVFAAKSGARLKNNDKSEE